MMIWKYVISFTLTWSHTEALFFRLLQEQLHIKGFEEVLRMLLFKHFYDNSCTVVIEELELLQKPLLHTSDKEQILPFMYITHNGNTSANLVQALSENCSTFVLTPKNICETFFSIYSVKQTSVQRKVLRFIVVQENWKENQNEWFNCNITKFFPHMYILTSVTSDKQNGRSNQYKLVSHSLGNNLLPVEYEVTTTWENNFPVVLNLKKLSNMKAINMTLTFFSYYPYTLVNDTSYDGIDYRVMVEFSKKLNFTWQVKLIDMSWGDVNDSNSYFGALLSGEYHAGIPEVFYIELYRKYFDLSITYAQADIKFLTPSPKLKSTLWSIFTPFTYQLWLSVIGLIFVSSFLLYLFATLHSKVNYIHRRNPYLCYGYSLISSVSIIVGFSLYKTSHSVVRHIIVWLFLMSTLLVTAYDCNLASFLTFPRYESPIDTMQQLVDSGIPWGTDDIGWGEVLEDTLDPLVRIFRNRYRFLDDYDDMNTLAKEGKIVLLIEQLPAGYSANLNHIEKKTLENVHLMKGHALRYHLGFAFHKNSPLLEPFNDFLVYLKDSGIIGQWEKDIAYEQMLYLGFEYTIENLRPLALVDIAGSFVLLFIGLVSSSLVLLTETKKCKLSVKL